MKKIKNIFMLCALFFALQVLTPPRVQAQCPMCKMSAESNLKAGGTAGKGLNQGILMLLMLPYVVVGGIGYVWYKNSRPESEL